MDIIQNNAIFDKWSFVHALLGVALKKTGTTRPIAYGIILGIEIIENQLLKTRVAELFKEQEGTKNVTSDIIIGILAYELTP